MGSVLAVCGTVFFAPASTAQVGGSTPIRPTEMTESLAEHTPVGRTSVPGIMARVGDAPVSPEIFFVQLPAGASGRICVQLLSKDGRYQARLEYPAQRNGNRELALDLPSNHRDELKKYSEVELAIRAVLRPDCHQAGGTSVLASWTAGPPDSQFVVLLNSDFATWVVRLASDGRVADRVTCQELTGIIVSYNRICRVPVDWAVDHRSLLIRSRQRSGQRFYFKDEPLHLSVAARTQR